MKNSFILFLILISSNVYTVNTFDYKKIVEFGFYGTLTIASIGSTIYGIILSRYKNEKQNRIDNVYENTVNWAGHAITIPCFILTLICAEKFYFVFVKCLNQK